MYRCSKTKLVAGMLWLVAATSHAQQAGKENFVDIKSKVSNVEYDIRYFGSNNFVGDKVDGYLASKCYIHKDAIAAVQAMVAELEQQGLKLKLFDCYRPEKAVAHFMRWAQDLTDTKTKAEYYPNLPKSALVGPYIAERSGHSRGFTMDVTLLKKDTNGQYQELDMGSAFDMFDPVSNTDNPSITAQQRANRLTLKNIMHKHGFAAYDMEWWHFTYADMSAKQKQQYYDFDVK